MTVARRETAAPEQRSCSGRCAVAKGIRKGGKDEHLIWGSIEVLVDPRTGEEVAAWRALNPVEASFMREAGYKVGDILSAEFHTDRNLNNFRQAHALAKFVRDNTEEFPPEMPSHEVLKRIQTEADIECDMVEEQAYIEGLGWVPLKRRKPRSLAFGAMKQEVWRSVFKRFKDYCISKYFPTWEQPEIAEFESILRGNLPP